MSKKVAWFFNHKVRQGHETEVAVDQEQATQSLDIFLVLELLKDEFDAFRRDT